MAFVGKEMEEMCIQKAFSILRKREPSVEMKDWHTVLSYLIRKKGEAALYEYAKTVTITCR